MADKLSAAGLLQLRPYGSLNAVTVDRRLNRRHQGVLPDGLSQKVDSAALNGADRRWNVAMSRDENDRGMHAVESCFWNPSCLSVDVKPSVNGPDEPSPAGTRPIVLDVLRFADDTTGKVLLTGGWSLPPAGSDVPLLRQQVHLSEPTDPSGYANQVAAMSRLLGQLADGIARRLSVPHEEHAT